MFIDEIKIYARAGHGGKGAVAFQREKYRPKGGPSGGNGGRGGDVILEADHDLNNLIGQYYQPRLLAQEGEGGLGKGMDGHAGKDLVVKVPCGTLVWRLTPIPDPEAEAQDSTGAEGKLPASSARRPLFRTAARARALEVDLTREDHQDEVPDRQTRADASPLLKRRARTSGRSAVSEETQNLTPPPGPRPDGE